MNENYFETKEGSRIFYNLVCYVSDNFVTAFDDQLEFSDKNEKSFFIECYDEWLNLPKEPTIFLLRYKNETPIAISDFRKNKFEIHKDGSIYRIIAFVEGHEYFDKFYASDTECERCFNEINEFILSGRKKLVLDWRE